MSGWLLQSVEIESFRGINNQSDPLRLQFKVGSVNSSSPPMVWETRLPFGVSHSGSATHTYEIRAPRAPKRPLILLSHYTLL
jgi:hypothetical protein